MSHNLMQAGADLAFPTIVPAMAGLDAGLPHERATRIAARRIFVAMKRVYLDAAAPLEGSAAARLRRRIRASGEPAELLALQDELLDALSPDDPRAAQHRRAVYRQLDELFPDHALTGFVPL